VVQRLTQPPAAGELDGGDGGSAAPSSRRVASRPGPAPAASAAPRRAVRHGSGRGRRAV